MSFNSPVFEYQETLEMYDEICELLKDRADLLKLFTDLIEKGDTTYETEETTSSDNVEVVCGKIKLKKDEHGYLTMD